MFELRKTILRIGIVTILLVIFYQIGWLAPLQEMLLRATFPISEKIYSWRSIPSDSNELSEEQLRTAYIDLLDRFRERQIDQANLAYLREENKELRALLNFTTTTERQIVGADIVGKSTDPLGSILIINQGAEAGIAIDNPVVAENGALIGLIVSVGSHTAEVRRIDDNRSKIAATVFNTDQSIGIVEGQHGISLQMNFIPQNELISIGDLVITSGLQQNIPRGISIGSVVSIEKEPYEPFQQAQITPVVNIDNISVVGVLVL